ncbi:PTS sugar transporter subunit IIC [Clostridium sp. 'White wine YQ']|uniref:PTS sugar transporter subunit IIC n=1 Tax=Clostridium sp. 'White wine YQ' TaxID=3027474 RepID=UPI0023673C02|nr:PTS sugar transporter subunit IIC [Clostridium sp. 'White wine YQ']MDD7792651.1 PTS sugar transporter subunit IIC [Clostridium sp. 'White wine YQ']
MKKFMAWMEEHFIPIAGKIGAQRHLVAIRDGFVAIMPLIMAGAFAVLINNLPLQFFQDFMLNTFGETWKTFGGDIWNGTFAIMSLLLVFTTSYSLAKSYESDGLAAGVVSFASLLIIYKGSTLDWAIPYAYLGTQGLFVSLILALIVTSIFVKLLGNPKLVIKMPDGVPPAVAKSFAALLPSIIILILVTAFKHIVGIWNISDIHASVFWTIQKPLSGIAGSLPGVLVIIFLQQLLWFFGLHGSNILAPVINTLLLPLTNANIDAFNAGKEIPNILNSQFLDSYVNMGGSGTTISLIIAIYIVSKNKAQKTIANLGVAPGLFNINEPVIFGMPIVLNPVYFIPFILVPMISAIIAYTLTALHIAPKIVVLAPWTMPPVLGAIMSTASIRGGLVALIIIAVGTFIYLPFVVAADKELAREAEESLAD